jgi:hypothetical protein
LMEAHDGCFSKRQGAGDVTNRSLRLRSHHAYLPAKCSTVNTGYSIAVGQYKTSARD